MTKLFIVHHVHNVGNAVDDVKLIGIYSSRKNAMDAVTRLQQQPGFREHPDGFSIDEYHLDKDYWIEGFISEK